MSSIVKYNSKNLVPVSNVAINHSMGSNVNDQCVRPVYTIDLNGYLIYNMGSPTSTGTFGDYTAEQCETIDSDERLNALLAKHCALGTLFSENYQELELGTTTGSPNLKAYPRVVSISLSDTSNPSYWGYTISLEADNLYCNGSPISPTGCPCVKSFEESWDISYDESEFISESGDNRLWKISHQISAVGVGVAGSGGLLTSPYECAKDFVCERKGANAVIPTTCIDGFNCSGVQRNYYESHSVDVANGSYSLTESWICSTGVYVESYSVETQESSDVACPTVSIQGSIRGFETRVSGIVPATGTRYYNAKSRWDALTAVTGVLAIAEEMSGYDLDENPVSGNVGRNRFTGEITYSYSYRKLPFRWLPSAKFEKVQTGGNWGEDAFSSVQILEGGEILHPLNYDSFGNVQGHKLLTRTLSIDAVYPCGTGISRKSPRFTAPYSGEIQAVVDYYNPTGETDIYFTVVSSQNENWDPQMGTYTYAITWTMQNNSGCSLF